MAQGIHLSDEDTAQLRKHVDRHDGMLLFDDFIDAMSLFHDESIEDHILAELDDPATRLMRTLRITLAQCVLFIVILVLSFMTNLAKLMINLYLVSFCRKTVTDTYEFDVCKIVLIFNIDCAELLFRGYFPGENGSLH